jgi:hypothetical protein
MIFVLHRARDGLWPMLQRFFPQQVLLRMQAEGAAPLARRVQPEVGSVLLEVKDASKRFGGLLANDHVSFALRAGEVLALDRPERCRQEHDVQRHFRR